MIAKRNHIRVFVASTVYNFEHILKQVYELLDSYGYDVCMSHMGTILLDSSQSNLDNCVNAVNECDIFVGFIRPNYGSGVLEKDGKSITHFEFETAFVRNIPRFVLADYRVVFTRAFTGSISISDNSGKTIAIKQLNNYSGNLRIALPRAYKGTAVVSFISTDNKSYTELVNIL
jgi:hypothetical protein